MRIKAGTNFDVAAEIGLCCAARCQHEAEVILATPTTVNGRLPLCDKHWEEHCEEKETVDGPETESAA